VHLQGLLPKTRVKMHNISAFPGSALQLTRDIMMMTKDGVLQRDRDGRSVGWPLGGRIANPQQVNDSCCCRLALLRANCQAASYTGM
jgi:hypothetical protein